MTKSTSSHESFSFRCIISLKTLEITISTRNHCINPDNLHATNINYVKLQTSMAAYEPEKILDLKDAFLHTNSKGIHTEPPLQMFILKLPTQCAKRGKRREIVHQLKRAPRNWLMLSQVIQKSKFSISGILKRNQSSPGNQYTSIKLKTSSAVIEEI